MYTWKKLLRWLALLGLGALELGAGEAPGQQQPQFQIRQPPPQQGPSQQPRQMQGGTRNAYNSNYYTPRQPVYNYNQYNAGYAGYPGYGGYGGYGYPGYGYGYDNVGGYLQGASSVISSQGQFMINNQQANLMKQQVKQSKVDSRRKTLDEWMYERNTLPTLEDERERSEREQVRRSLNNPPLTEIWSGAALNTILTDLQRFQRQGGSGPDVYLNPAMLEHINLTTGVDSGNVGTIKNGRLEWPVALRSLKPADKARALRENLEKLLPMAIKEAMQGQVDAQIIDAMSSAIGLLRGLLLDQVAELPPNQYIEAKRYLTNLDDSVKVLQQPNAGKFFNGAYRAQGKTVQDLVQYLTAQGLRFAPATQGDQSAYTALHSALVEYDLGAKSMLAAQRPAGPPPAQQN